MHEKKQTLHLRGFNLYVWGRSCEVRAVQEPRAATCVAASCESCEPAIHEKKISPRAQMPSAHIYTAPAVTTPLTFGLFSASRRAARSRSTRKVVTGSPRRYRTHSSS